MIKHIIIIFLAIFWFQPPTFCQQKTSVTDFLKGKFSAYCAAEPWEDIFVHTDRETYMAGEDIWFKIYLTDRQSNKPSTSKIAYFEVLNPYNRPVIQKRIKIENGLGPGQVVLPDTLSPGTYMLRVYTNWMKNFLPLGCFIKNINIYNAISTASFKKKIFGNHFTKQAGDNINNKPLIQGFSLKINNLKPDTLELFIRTNEEFRKRNDNLSYLFIQTHGIINYVNPVVLSSGTTKIILPKKILIPGINHISIFDNSGWPLIERFIYSPVKDEQSLILNSPDDIKTRSKISLEIDIDKYLFSSSNSASISISVAPETHTSEVSGISEYMIFGTEFGIIPEEIRNRKLSEIPVEILDEYLMTIKSNWIDWRSILSEELPVLKYKSEKENHFLTGKLVNRINQEADSDKYVFLSKPGKVATFQYAKTDRDGNFSFNLPVGEALQDIIIQPEEIKRNNTIKIESSFSEEYLPLEYLSDTSIHEIPPYISKWSINYQVKKIYVTSSIGQPGTIIRPQTGAKRFYGKPDIELVMDDYIKLPVMQEVFFELIPGVFLKSRKSIYEISIADPAENKIYDKTPVLFIDGVIVDDPSIIANLDPEIVEKIDAVKERYFVGDYLFYGLVSVITRAGDYSCVSLPDYAVRIPYRVVDPVNSFLSPDYSAQEAKQSRIPDFRNTLYWNPSILLSKEGKAIVEFWTSDYPSDYKIDLEGITSEGKPVSYKKIIKIK